MVVFGGETAPGQLTNEVWSLSFDAPTPTLVSFAGAEATPDRVRLIWEVADAAAIRAEVHRRASGDIAWSELGRPAVEGDRLVFEDRDVVPGTRYRYRLIEAGAVLDEQWVTVPGATLALAGASPNPSPGGIAVEFSLSSSDRATLELFDLRGRLIAQREVGSLGAGAHHMALAGPGDLAAGVYLIRLVRGEQVLTAKACVVR